MLAQSFKSAADLGITEPQFEALRKTLVLAETGKLKHVDPTKFQFSRRNMQFTGHFNMGWWLLSRTCGTCCCLGGTAELIGGLIEDELDLASKGNAELYNLFYPGMNRPCVVAMKNINPTQAATALRSYLTTGDARWDLAVS